jgi:hypothetical protein
MDKIPAGFQIHVTSWENDGDNYKTVVTSGLSKEEVCFYMCILKNFTNTVNYGNDYVERSIINNIILRAIESTPSLDSKTVEEWTNAVNDKKEYSYDLENLIRKRLLSSPYEGYGRDFYRAVDNIRVYYVPNDIVEVTKDFKFKCGVIYEKETSICSESN